MRERCRRQLPSVSLLKSAADPFTETEDATRGSSLGGVVLISFLAVLVFRSVFVCGFCLFVFDFFFFFQSWRSNHGPHVS